MSGAPLATSEPVVIVRTGAANLASVIAALDRLHVAHTLSSDPGQVREAGRVILPGVGAFGAAMDALCAHRLDEALRERIERGTPTLAICLGLQLLARSSEESPGVEGIGVLDAEIVRLSDESDLVDGSAQSDRALRVPQMGWNMVTPEAAASFDAFTEGYAYYANSYCLRTCPAGWSAAWTEYGSRFVAAVQREGVLACQFHPELSGPWGQRLIDSWLLRSGRTQAGRRVIA